MGKDTNQTDWNRKMSRSKQITLAAVLLAMAGGIALLTRNKKTTTTIMSDKKLPRGYRNNNPLNIRISSSKWQGEVTENTDGVFEQFVAMEYGYRAALKLIQNYINNYGLHTVSEIISRWAPNNENNTSGYISRVCSSTGWTPAKEIDPYNREDMTDLVYAMALVENGVTILPDYTQIYKGWEML